MGHYQVCYRPVTGCSSVVKKVSHRLPHSCERHLKNLQLGTLGLAQTRHGLVFTEVRHYQAESLAHRAFVNSTERLVRFTQGKIVTHVLGCHIEQGRTNYQDYPVGTQYPPDEHSLELRRGSLLELNDALASMQEPKRLELRDLTIWLVSDKAETPAGQAQ